MTRPSALAVLRLIRGLTETRPPSFSWLIRGRSFGAVVVRCYHGTKGSVHPQLAIVFIVVLETTRLLPTNLLAFRVVSGICFSHAGDRRNAARNNRDTCPKWGT
jgi:hypothetical protein